MRAPIRTFVGAAVCVAAAAPAHAVNTWDLISRTIPASACQVRDARQQSRVEVYRGGWRFLGNNVGSVTFTCPLPLSYFPADMALAAGDTMMTFFRVWYLDSDGPVAGANVGATPYLRTDQGVWTNVGLWGGGGGVVPAGICQFNSNSHPDVLFATRVKDCVHAIALNAIYSFEVVLTRNAVGQTVEFHGIDFWDGTQEPPG